MEADYPADEWIYVFTDGSPVNSVSNGGREILIKIQIKEESAFANLAGKICSNCKAEHLALIKAVEEIKNLCYRTGQVVFLTDASSVLQAIKSEHEEVVTLATKL